MSILIKDHNMPSEGNIHLLEIRHDGTVFDAITRRRVAAQAVQFDEDAVSPWHRVEEKPKEGQTVVAMDRNEDMEVVTFDGHGFEDSYGFYFTDVIYWMPIEPPKEDA